MRWGYGQYPQRRQPVIGNASRLHPLIDQQKIRYLDDDDLGTHGVLLSAEARPPMQHPSWSRWTDGFPFSPVPMGSVAQAAVRARRRPRILLFDQYGVAFAD